ncbi:hypothetical protein ANRL1_00936 [Anaerolineae bacterium]|nr:hypothetical protein ANRL1_00936 [Anaerolineae bacterium]
MVIIAELKSDDKMIGVLTVSPKDFKTGSRGFYGQSKIEIDGKRYQVQVQMVEIGSKTKTDEK